MVLADRLEAVAGALTLHVGVNAMWSSLSSFFSPILHLRGTTPHRVLSHRSPVTRLCEALGALGVVGNSVAEAETSHEKEEGVACDTADRALCVVAVRLVETSDHPQAVANFALASVLSMMPPPADGPLPASAWAPLEMERAEDGWVVVVGSDDHGTPTVAKARAYEGACKALPSHTESAVTSTQREEEEEIVWFDAQTELRMKALWQHTAQHTKCEALGSRSEL